MRTYIFSLFISCCILFYCSCEKKSISGITELSFDKDLIPEGIAIDPSTHKVYLNSLKDNKIVRSNFDGTEIETVVSSGQYNYQSGFGMSIKGDTLYALGNGLTADDNTSILLLINTNNNELIRSYTLEDTSHVYLNDIAISSNHEVYITDSRSNAVYTVNKETNELELFLDTEETPIPNGIAISDDNKLLYITSWEGIRIFDLQSKEIVNKNNEENQGIDGLKYYNNSLIGIINVWGSDSPRNGMYKFDLSTDGKEIINKTKIISFDERFGVATTFSIIDDHVGFIMNTQLENFDDKKNVIKEPDSLSAYKLLIHPLD